MATPTTQYFLCERCGAIISVEQPDPYETNAVKYPLTCFMEQGGCGRRTNMKWVELGVDDKKKFVEVD